MPLNFSDDNDNDTETVTTDLVATADTTTTDDTAEKPPAVLDGKQLVVSSNQSSGAPISFALTDAQFSQALTLFAPPPRTKANLWTSKVDPTFIRKLVKVVAYLESVQYMRPGGTCFASTLISNHFDSVMLEKFRETLVAAAAESEDADLAENASFSIDEWFTDTRGPIPEALKKWNPKKFEPMPVVPMQVDWYGALTVAELQFSGFVDLFMNCILLEEETDAEMARRKHGAMTTFGTHPGDGTAMPKAINQQASFENFTPSRVGTGSAMFAASGALRR